MTSAEVLPSMREATISNTEKFGPKMAHHMTPAEVAAHAAEEAAQKAAAEAQAASSHGALLPSMREATISNTKKFGPKAGSNRPSDVGADTKGGAAGGATPTTAAPAAKAAPTAAAAAPSTPATVAATPAPAAAAKTPAAKTAPAAATVTKAASASSNTPAARAATSSVAAPPTATSSASLTTKVAVGVFAVGAAALTVFSIYKGVEMYNRYRLRQCVAEIEAQNQDVVHVYIHRRSPLAPSVSVPCTRLETYLRVAGIPYEAHVVSDPSVSPNGRLPFVTYGGEQLAGVVTITTRLNLAYGIDLDRLLSPEERATGNALLAALSYSLTKGYLRSVHVDAQDLIRPYYSEMNQTPDWLTRIALSRMRKAVLKTNTTTGYSKLTTEQYQHDLFDDVKAIEGLLMNGTEFLFGNAGPSSYDCALYAWLLPIVAMEEAAEVNEAFEYAVQSEPITAYVKRMTDLAFPDLDELVNEGRGYGSRSHSMLNAQDEIEAIENVAAADADLDLAEAAQAEEAGLEAHIEQTSRCLDLIPEEVVSGDEAGDVEAGDATARDGEEPPMDIPMVDSPTNRDDAVEGADMDADEL